MRRLSAIRSESGKENGEKTGKFNSGPARFGETGRNGDSSSHVARRDTREHENRGYRYPLESIGCGYFQERLRNPETHEGFGALRPPRFMARIARVVVPGRGISGTGYETPKRRRLSDWELRSLFRNSR